MRVRSLYALPVVSRMQSLARSRLHMFGQFLPVLKRYDVENAVPDAIVVDACVDTGADREDDEPLGLEESNGPLPGRAEIFDIMPDQSNPGPC